MLEQQLSPQSAPLARPLRLLIVAPSLEMLGGQAIQASRLLNRLREEPGLEVGFLPINPRLPGGLRRFQTIKYLRTLVTSITYVASLFCQVWKYDVVHVFSAAYFSFILSPTPAILIGRLYGKKLILNYHSGEAEDHLTRWRRLVIPIIRLVDEIAVPSSYLVEVFSKFGLSAKPISNLIDMDKFCFRERHPLRSIFLSNRNFEVHYGVDRVLRAFAIIQQRIPQAQLIIAGDGPERDALRRLARELKLRNIRFVGRVEPERITELYDSADVFLNGSEIDNQPLSILEAFACGLPVVTTNAGGIAGMVHNGITGLLVPKGAADQLAASALRLFEDPDLARRVVSGAYQESLKYQWENLGEQWLRLYQELGSSERALRSDADREGVSTAHRVDT